VKPLGLLAVLALATGSAPERVRSVNELEWISTCGLVSGQRVEYCKIDADELFRLGYFDINMQVEEN